MAQTQLNSCDSQGGQKLCILIDEPDRQTRVRVSRLLRLLREPVEIWSEDDQSTRRSDTLPDLVIRASSRPPTGSVPNIVLVHSVADAADAVKAGCEGVLDADNLTPDALRDALSLAGSAMYSADVVAKRVLHSLQKLPMQTLFEPALRGALKDVVENYKASGPSADYRALIEEWAQPQDDLQHGLMQLLSQTETEHEQQDGN